MQLNIREPRKGIHEIEIASKTGQTVSLLTAGASVTGWKTASGIGIVAAYRDVAGYLKGGMYLGTVVGPNAGRIENGSFTLGGKAYRIAENGPHFLHCGKDSLSFRVFDYEIVKNDETHTVVRFHHVFKHAVLPGAMDVTVRYEIREGSVKIVYDVTSDAETLCNLTNHSYFNLDGDFARDLSSHSLRIDASNVVSVDDEIIGRDLIPIAGTPFDFTKEKPVMPTVLAIKATGHLAKGLDHWFPFDGKPAPQIRLSSAKTGLWLAVATTCPGVTVYSGNYPMPAALRSGTDLAQHGAICFETQFQANAVNDGRFAAGLVSPSRPYHQETTFRLGGRRA